MSDKIYYVKSLNKQNHEMAEDSTVVLRKYKKVSEIALNFNKLVIPASKPEPAGLFYLY